MPASGEMPRAFGSGLKLAVDIRDQHSLQESAKPLPTPKLSARARAFARKFVGA
jgi:hypothetical protein